MHQFIPENIIRKCAEHLSDTDPNNSFTYLLEEGDKFKEADLTPIYIMNPETAAVTVTSKQRLEKKFH